MTLALMKLLGGLVLFLLGTDWAAECLEKYAVRRIRSVLNWITRNRLFALIFGALVTVTLQSSSATSVLLISFVNSSLLRLEQALPVLLGANIGTTFALQMLSLDVSFLPFICLGIGFFVMKWFKTDPGRDCGRAVVGFGLLFLGMGLMRESSDTLRDAAFVQVVLNGIHQSPWLGLFVGTVFTGLIHASTASIALIMAFTDQSVITLQDALPLMLGANIGTCSTALLASMGRGPNAWRLSIGNLLMKVVGVMLLFPFLDLFAKGILWMSQYSPLGNSGARWIADAHTVFNIAVSFLLLPTSHWAAAFFKRLIPEKNVFEPFNLEKEGVTAIQKGIFQMAERIREMMKEALKLFRDNQSRSILKVAAADEEIDLLNAEFEKFLTQCAHGRFGSGETASEERLLYLSDYLEHIGDVLSKEVSMLGRKKIAADIEFSIEGQAELEEFFKMIYNFFDQTFSSGNNIAEVKERELIRLYEEIKLSKRKIYLEHYERVRKGIRETVQSGPVFLDLVTALEKIADFTLAILQINSSVSIDKN